MKDRQLLIELVPVQAHGRNLRSILSKDLWSRISKMVRDLCGNECDYCDEKATDCHEVWEWVVKHGILVQRLIDLEPVCKKCHGFKHLAGTIMRNKRFGNICFEHASNVNMWSFEKTIDHLNSCAFSTGCLSDIKLSDKMDLKWILNPAIVDRLNLTIDDIKQISDYLSDEPDNAETFKEDHAGEDA